ncbi:hypothetical protein LTR28_006151 [Elasticomyces elasticus]|nr:hypothetical protein LTR28_006151 [Elasticomyces elasticus]
MAKWVDLHTSRRRIRHKHEILRSRKSQTTKTQAVKYCSERCKRHKPSTAPDSTDRRIERAFVLLLNGTDPTANDDTDPTTQSLSAAAPTNKKEKPSVKKTKGDPRIIVDCTVAETAIFGDRSDPTKTFGRRKNRARRGVPDDDVWKSVDMVDEHDAASAAQGSLTDSSSIGDAVHDTGSDSDAGGGGAALDDAASDSAKTRVRPPQSRAEVNGSVGGEKGWAERVEETSEMLARRRDGQRRAEEREMVRCVARRACAFGLPVGVVGEGREKGQGRERKAASRAPDGGGEGRRKCEAVMNGAVVEASFAKGEWGIRWRE